MEEKGIFFASYNRLTRLAEQVLDSELLDQLEICNESFDQLLKICNQKIADNAIDVIISGGSNYLLLRENIKSIPVIQVEVSGFDLLEALNRASTLAPRAAVISYKDHLPWLEDYSRLFKIQVEYASYTSRAQLVQLLAELNDRGYRQVLGTSLVCELAQEQGFDPIFLYSRASLVTAVRRAVELRESIQREQERSQQLALILDMIPSGIIATDQRGEITLYNHAAEQLTGIPIAAALGKNIKRVLPTTRLPRVLNSGEAEKDQLQTMPNGLTILTNRAPIILRDRVRGALATFNATEEITRAEHQIRVKLHRKGLVARHTFEDIVGSSKAISEARKLAKIYAREETTVLLTGETGTGKELFAQAIHNYSFRRAQPFVTINCAALPENLLESELFGYDEGAFTGARKGGKAGLLELGHQGTIFLDEIGQISDKVQSRLLRVLEEKEIMRVGSDKVIPVNIRVIAAANVSLLQEVERGHFRRDLFYRLNVLHVVIPPLRERKEDLAELLLAVLQQEDKEEMRQLYRERFSQALKYLKDYSWPGNVREFRSVVQRLCLVFANDLDLEFAFRDLVSTEGQKTGETGDEPSREAILRALEYCGGSKAKAAELLGFSRTTLWRRMKALGLSH